MAAHWEEFGIQREPIIYNRGTTYSFDVTHIRSVSRYPEDNAIVYGSWRPIIGDVSVTKTVNDVKNYILQRIEDIGGADASIIDTPIIELQKLLDWISESGQEDKNNQDRSLGI
jgi:hypothetical protein